MNKRKNIIVKLMLIFTIMPLLELYLLIKISNMTSWIHTVIIVIATGTIGAYLAKKEGKQIFDKIQSEINSGKIPEEQLLNGLCVLVGGIFLITPGIITDILGFTLLVPFTRIFYKKIIKIKLKDMIQKGNINIFKRE